MPRFTYPQRSLSRLSTQQGGVPGNILDANVLFLDSGNEDSYPGTGQFYSNIVEYYNNKEHDFNLGATTSPEASDPTFVGTAGDASVNTYFLHDGAQYSRLITANSAFLDTMHRQDGRFTFLVAIDVVDVTTGQQMLSTRDTGLSGDYGAWFYIQNGDLIGGVNSTAGLLEGTTPLTTGLHVLMLGYDGAGTTVRLSLDGVVTDTTVAANTDTTSSAGSPLHLGSRGAGERPVVNGTRIYAAAIWNSLLSEEDMQTQSAVFEARLGI